MSEELKPVQAEWEDPLVQAAVRDFRSSLEAWSEAAYHRARPAVAAAPRSIAWRRTIAWVLTLVVSIGILGTAGYERHHRNVIARQHEQQVRELERQRALAEQRARETEDLMANVDSDISREVPAAMEPLAQLMADEQ